MNIFYLSHNVFLCAQWHCDKHIVKMILEYAQLLCSAHHILDGPFCKWDDRICLYRLTHKNHPCAVWTRDSNENYKWLYQLFCALCDEYTNRYKKVHKTDEKLRDVLKHTPCEIPEDKFIKPPQAMPEEYKTDSSIDAYRIYYKYGKKDITEWRYTQTPWWISF